MSVIAERPLIVMWSRQGLLFVMAVKSRKLPLMRTFAALAICASRPMAKLNMCRVTQLNRIQRRVLPPRINLSRLILGLALRLPDE